MSSNKGRWVRYPVSVAIYLSRYGVLRAERGEVGPVSAGELTAWISAWELLAGGDGGRVLVARSRGHQPGQDGPLRHLDKRTAFRQPLPYIHSRVRYTVFSVSDPDWIRIQSGQWIRIRIRNPDPGGQKWLTKVEKIKKFHVLKCWISSFDGWRLLL